MTGYTKLFSSIVTSTIWAEDSSTRILWITMLALKGADGMVEGSVPGLAHQARLSLSETEAALNKLQNPDSYSRSKEHEGRRIKEVAGGWLILNHAKYREKMNADERREYKTTWMREKRAAERGQSVDKCGQMCTVSTQSDSDSDSDSETDSEKAKSRSLSRERVSRGTPLPENFIPTKEHYRLAAERGVDCLAEVEKCRDYYLSIGETRVDWAATVRNWFKKPERFFEDG